MARCVGSFNGPARSGSAIGSGSGQSTIRRPESPQLADRGRGHGLVAVHEAHEVLPVQARVAVTGEIHGHGVDAGVGRELPQRELWQLAIVTSREVPTNVEDLGRRDGSCRAAIPRSTRPPQGGLALGAVGELHRLHGLDAQRLMLVLKCSMSAVPPGCRPPASPQVLGSGSRATCRMAAARSSDCCEPRSSRSPFPSTSCAPRLPRTL